METVLGLLNGLKKNGNGWTARCPGHDDHKNSLSVSQGADNRVLLKCFAGCTVEDIVSAMGLKMTDLFSDNGNHTAHSNLPKSPKVTVASLAVDKGLPEEFLRKLGLTDLPTGVKIPYRLLDGKPAPRQRIRTALKARDGSYWSQGAGAPTPYGAERLAEVRQQGGNLILVEGESDSWTLWFHSYPALGIPGADMAKTLETCHLDGFFRLYVVQEPDRGGETFVTGISRRLKELGWNGQALVIKLPDVKDVNDFYKKYRETFKEELKKTLAAATLPEPQAKAELLNSSNSFISYPQQEKPWPKDLKEEAFYGLAGRIVRALEPITEADPAALLLNLLVAVGAIFGRGPHLKIGGDKHPPRLFGILVGKSSKSRKGSSWSIVLQLLRWVMEEIVRLVASGLSSGEGLIWAVRDPIRVHEPVRQKGRVVDYQEVEIDPGVLDKRLIVVEPEFARTLKVMGREGNVLSAVIRQAWDSGNLRVMTKNNPAQATEAHISISGHITTEELLRNLDSTESANGFANRFLWMAVKRSKCLPEGGQPSEDELLPLIEELRKAIIFSQNVQEVHLDEEARRIWHKVYPQLSDGYPGMFGSVTGRAEAQVLRISLVYALLDCSDNVRGEHLLAALAFWDRVEESVRYIFGDRTGDPMADVILEALRNTGGLNQTAISALFGRNQNAEKINQALVVLCQAGLAQVQKRQTRGRPELFWIPIYSHEGTKTTK